MHCHSSRSVSNCNTSNERHLLDDHATACMSIEFNTPKSGECDRHPWSSRFTPEIPYLKYRFPLDTDGHRACTTLDMIEASEEGNISIFHHKFGCHESGSS